MNHKRVRAPVVRRETEGADQEVQEATHRHRTHVGAMCPWGPSQGRLALESLWELADLEDPLTRKVRILYTIPNFVTAGSGQAMVNIIDRLDRNRFEPSVAVSRRGGKLVDHLESSGVDVIEAPVAVDPQPVRSLPIRVWRARQPFVGRFDIWHSFNWQGDFTEPLIAYSSGAKSWLYTKKNMGFASKSWRLRSLLASRIAVQNDEMTRLFFRKQWFRYKVRYVPTGIDVEPWQAAAADDSFRERHSIPEGSVVIVSVGNVHPNKNQGALVPVLKDLDGAHLVLAGRILDAGYSQELADAAEAVGAGERLHQIGLVENVAGMLKQCDIFALVSHSEGSPVAMLEAMAVGVPGVYSAIPGIRERITDSHDGFLADPDDGRAIVERLCQLAEAPNLRSSMGGAARSTAELRGRVESEVARYETLYLELGS